MRHWHVFERAARMGGTDRDLAEAHATAREAWDRRADLQQGSNVHGTGRHYAVRSCERRECR